MIHTDSFNLADTFGPSCQLSFHLGRDKFDRVGLYNH